MTDEMSIENVQPDTDLRAYRRCLGSFGTGVTIVTACDGGSYAGLTANSFTSVSLNPPLVMWSVDKKSSSLASFRRASAFAINILSLRQIELANRFAKSGEGKFEGVEWAEGRLGAPVLPDVAAALECEPENCIEAGDHIVFIARVKSFSMYNERALLYVRGQYSQAISHPNFVHEPSGHSPREGPGEETTNYLLRQAYLSLSSAFEAERQAVGVKYNQSRVLFGLQRNPGATVDALARELFLSEAEVTDTIRELRELDYLRPGPNSCFEITPEGTGKCKAIMERLSAFERDRYSGLSADDIKTLRHVLLTLMKV